MNIPLTVNFSEFYSKAKAKGISVTSRYTGVAINTFRRETFNPVSSHAVKFVAIAWWDGKNHILGYFPFTKEGEEEAHRTYVEYKQQRDPSYVPKLKS